MSEFSPGEGLLLLSKGIRNYVGGKPLIVSETFNSDDFSTITLDS